MDKSSNLPSVGSSSIILINSDDEDKYIGEAPISTEGVMLSSFMPVVVEVPQVGTMSVVGRSWEMKDALTVKTPMCFPEICGRKPVHFFGVYDGHVGAHVSNLCKDRFHELLADELLRWSAAAALMAESSNIAPTAPPTVRTVAEDEGWWRVLLARCFQRMDDVAMNTCACGSFGFQCRCFLNESMLLSGSTALVAVLTEGYILVGNVGDSRAVLSRGGRAIPLSTDQKPDRADERARIESSGRRVIDLNGSHVEGIFGMSRALGVKHLKSAIISVPEITFTRRHSEDEFVIMASNGLWDVMSNEVACDMVRECFRDNSSLISPPHSVLVGHPDVVPGIIYPSRRALAANQLMNHALSNMSEDNISVIVVDLKKTRCIMCTI